MIAILLLVCGSFFDDLDKQMPLDRPMDQRTLRFIERSEQWDSMNAQGLEPDMMFSPFMPDPMERQARLIVEQVQHALAKEGRLLTDEEVEWSIEFTLKLLRQEENEHSNRLHAEDKVLDW